MAIGKSLNFKLLLCYFRIYLVMQSYEFNITIVGSGSDVDEAFSNALNKLSEDAGAAIKGEVIYVSISNCESSKDKSDIDN